MQLKNTSYTSIYFNEARHVLAVAWEAGSFNDEEAIADELNPLSISPIAMTISCTAIGRAKTVWKSPDIPSNPAANTNMHLHSMISQHGELKPSSDREK